MENTETTTEVSTEIQTVKETAKETPTITVSAELTKEQYAFLTNWQKMHEQELGISIPIGAMVRKAIDGAMKSATKREENRDERPPRGDRPMGGRSFDKPGFQSGPRKSFGDRPMGRGPKFDMTGPRNKARSFK